MVLDSFTKNEWDEWSCAEGSWAAAEAKVSAQRGMTVEFVKIRFNGHGATW